MRILSWNIKQFNYNPDKPSEDQQFRILQIATLIEDVKPDVVAIMEIRPGTSSGTVNQQLDHSQGVLATEQLVSYLEKIKLTPVFSGFNAIRQPTAGELYAVLYNAATVEPLSDLSVVYHDNQSQSSKFTNRAPAFVSFLHKVSQKVFSVMVFHAPKPSDMSISQIHSVNQLGAMDFGNVIICGDFNMDTTAVAAALGAGFNTAIGGIGTSLRVNPNGQDSAYDAIFYQAQSHLLCTGNGVLNPMDIAEEASSSTGLSKQEISSTKRLTSDHAGVWAQFEFKP